ncbi:MAG: hypothetical protein RBT62_09695 [Spirochaetia bacterium]|nr:hypothetical protein [Spirochaetia bacterium]
MRESFLAESLPYPVELFPRWTPEDGTRAGHLCGYRAPNFKLASSCRLVKGTLVLRSLRILEDTACFGQ